MPRIHWFNGAAEAEVARGRPGFQPRQEAAALLVDLEALPLFYADPGDAVLVSSAPSGVWLAQLEDLGFTVPAFVTTPTARADLEPAPWGMSPDAAHRLGGVYDPAMGALYAKSSWVGLLAEIVASDVSGLSSPADVGRVCRTLPEVERALDGARAGGASVVAVKAPWGTSGRGTTRAVGALLPSQLGWVRRILAEQGAVLVEPWRPRELDLSVQLTVDDRGAQVLGVTTFATDDRGQYIGTWLRAAVPAAALPLLEHTAALVGARLSAAGYRGHAGIDAITYRDDAGALRLKPLLEVNPRTTMGRVALALERRLAPGVSGVWRLLGRRHLPATGAEDLPALARALATRHPIRRGSAGLEAGALFTNDPSRAHVCLGVALIGESAEAADLAIP